MRTVFIMALCVLICGCTTFKVQDPQGNVIVDYSSFLTFREADYIEINIDPNTSKVQIVAWYYVSDPEKIEAVTPYMIIKAGE